MAHIKQNVLGVLKGKVGTLSTYSNNTGNVARIRTNATNVGESASRTKKQQSNRVRWANLVNFYKASKPWMPKAFETKKSNRSDYNQFMSINYAFAKVALTKQEAAAGACVVEGFMVSQGSLAPVQVQKHGSHWDTNLALGELIISDVTTVAQLSSALINNNNFIREGMQLSFVSYQQIVDDMGTPRVICTPYEIVLDTKNTEERAMSYLPDFCLASSEGVLCTGDDISVGGFAYVLSETVSGRTMVSTQAIILNNETLIEKYTGTEQIAEAIKSYGLSANVFLDSDYADAKAATPQPLFIEKIVPANYYTYLVAGSKRPTLGELFGSSMSDIAQFKLSAPVLAAAVTNAAIGDSSTTSHYDLIVVSVQGDVVNVKKPGGSGQPDSKVASMSVTIDSVVYTIAFAEE